MDQNILQTLREKMLLLSKGKKNAAQYILDHPHEAAFQTAAVIGKNVKVSESTVVRLASDLGYKGFPELQKALQQMIMTQFYSTSVEQPSMEASVKAASINDKCIENCDSQIQNGVECLTHLRDLYIYGSGIARPVVHYVGLCAEYMCAHIQCLFGLHEEYLHTLSHIGPGDVMMAVILGKYCNKDIATLSIAKEMGATVVLITDSDNGFLSENSDCVIQLPCTTGSIPPDLSVATKTVYRLFTELAKRRNSEIEQLAQIMTQMNDIYNGKEF